MLRGLTTVNFFADDVAEARDWYAEALGVEAYFERPVDDRPAYIEFRIGDYQHELGILDSRFAPHRGADGPAGAMVYWHVDEIEPVMDRFVALGATVHQRPIKHGEGFVTASVRDPFGNVLGLMYNEHYLQIWDSLPTP
ncbi:VOC family protein [Actinokineospora pegani]|uniref:VOC family protein n=1 Tax=Actinokineospora pegani TaxID=2654637 RepID=UPI0012E9DC03|nr:VOC family protein [Actinokineospora pegani]